MVETKRYAPEDVRLLTLACPLRDLRPCDQEEFQDLFQNHPWYQGGSTGGQGDFIPMEVLGLNYPDVKAVVTTYQIFWERRVAFIATSYCAFSASYIRVLCGFGLAQADEDLTNSAKVAIARSIVEELILPDLNDFCSFFCHVKATNRKTLSLWKYLGKVYADKFTVEIHDSLFMTGYKSVIITRKCEEPSSNVL